MKYKQAGLEAYLAKESERFERHYRQPEGFGRVIPASAVVIGGGLAIYELISFGIAKILDRTSSDSN